MNRALTIIVAGLFLLLGWCAYSAMCGLTYPYGKTIGCTNPACRCLDCECANCQCGTTPVVVEPQPPEPVKLRAYVVVGCKDERCPNPRCPSAPHLAIVKELRERGWQLTLLDKSEAATLPIEGDKYPYVVVTADGQAMGGKFLTTAFDIGTWLNEQRAGVPGGEWDSAGSNAPAQGASAGSGLYSLALVTDPEHCPPCAALERDRHSIEEELEATFHIVPPGSQEFPCRSIPTVFLLLDGKPVDQTSGYRGKRAFLSWLAKAEKANGGRWR